jgi:pimeloyl-ACP methyl ester carboxylesterase
MYRFYLFFFLFIIFQPLVSQQSPFPKHETLANKKIGAYAIKPGKFGKYSADFGRILVPENRHIKKSRSLQLIFLRIHALNSPTSEPVFLLQGGPGKTNFRGLLAPVFFTQNDLIIVGYRGIDTSVKLECPEVSQAFTIENPLSPKGISHIRKTIQSTYNRFKQEGIDMDGYTVLEVVDDIEAVRDVLGYKRINLFSVSYGTILSYLYCQRYPQSVNRNLMIGASNISYHLIRKPEAIDAIIRDYGKLWRKDPLAREKSPDIVTTLQSVLKKLPQTWRGIKIDPDKIRLCTYWLLYEVGTAAQILDSFVAAENGDYSGLALLSVGYDQEMSSRKYLGDYFTKAISTGLDTSRDLVKEMDPSDSIIGSPSCKLFLGCSSQGAWPIKPIPEKYRTISNCDVETLIVMGSLDLSGPPQYVKEMMPYFKKGRLVILPNMGHMDPVNLQPEAFNHMGLKFYNTGKVDTSKFIPLKLDFNPKETYQGVAKKMFKEKPAKE